MREYRGHFITTIFGKSDSKVAHIAVLNNNETELQKFRYKLGLNDSRKKAIGKAMDWIDKHIYDKS